MKFSIKHTAVILAMMSVFCLALSRSNGQIPREQKASEAKSHSLPKKAKANPKSGAASHVVKINVGSAPAIAVAKPGTNEARRIEILRAKTELGLVPIHQLGGVPNPQSLLNPEPALVGTRITPDPNAKGAALKYQQEFAALFSKLDPNPVNRFAHFSWLPKLDHVRQIGWWGTILSVQPQVDGSFIVRIRISPHLYSAIMKTLVMDYVEEEYVFSNGVLQLLNSDAAVPKPALQVFPIH